MMWVVVLFLGAIVGFLLVVTWWEDQSRRDLEQIRRMEAANEARRRGLGDPPRP